MCVRGGGGGGYTVYFVGLSSRTRVLCLILPIVFSIKCLLFAPREGGGGGNFIFSSYVRVCS